MWLLLAFHIVKFNESHFQCLLMPEKLRELKKTDILFKYDADLNANYYCLRHHESTKADQSAVGLGANPNPALMQKRRKKKERKTRMISGAGRWTLGSVL